MKRAFVGAGELDDLAPDGILAPAQYLRLLRRHTKVVSGEQRLMLALLADAFRVLLKPGLRNGRLGMETRSWLAGVPAAVSFDDACEAVGLNPSATRFGMSKLLDVDHDRYRQPVGDSRGSCRRPSLLTEDARGHLDPAKTNASPARDGRPTPQTPGR